MSNSHGAPRVGLTGCDGGNGTPLSSLRCTSSTSSGCSPEAPAWLCGRYGVDPGIHYPSATDLAGGRSPNVEGDHWSSVAGKTVVTQTHRRTTPHSLDLFEPTKRGRQLVCSSRQRCEVRVAKSHACQGLYNSNSSGGLIWRRARCRLEGGWCGRLRSEGKAGTVVTMYLTRQVEKIWKKDNVPLCTSAQGSTCKSFQHRTWQASPETQEGRFQASTKRYQHVGICSNME